MEIKKGWCGMGIAAFAEPVERQKPFNRLEEMAMDGKYTLKPDVVAGILGIHPQRLREIAQDEKARAGLGFPVTVAGRSILIPKVPFLRFMGYDGDVYLP